MLRIPCPYCGLRDEPEFVYGGEWGILRPADATDEEWALYLFYRRNPKGLHRERWYHEFGCGQWLAVDRNTVTHEFSGSHAIHEEAAAAAFAARPDGTTGR